MNNIEIHIDFACPFSYLGGERMIQFLEKHDSPLSSIRFRSFQLKPDDDNTKRSYLENRFKASGLNTVEDFRKFFKDKLEDPGAKLGIKYDIDTVISVNSIHAHLGLQYATLFNKQAEYFRKIMSGHFSEGKDFYDFEFINNILKELELNVEDFHKRIDDMKLLVNNDLNLAKERGIRTVPVFYQDKIVLMGTGSFEEFEKFMIN